VHYHSLPLWNKRHECLCVGRAYSFVVEGPPRRECMRAEANTLLTEGAAKELGVVRIGLLGGFSVTG
jgi:hypothetical protein